MKFFKTLISVVLTLTMLSACGNGGDTPSAAKPEDNAKPAVTPQAQAQSQTAQVSQTAEAAAKPVSGKLPAPSNIKTECSDSVLIVTWDHVDGSDAYRVYSFEPSVNDYVAFLEIADDGFYAAGLFPNTTYTVKVATLKGSSGNYEEHGITDPISITTQASSSGGGSSGSNMCAVCCGSGQCRICEGKGYAAYYVGSGAGKYHPTCSSCNGTTRCAYCGGTGYVR